MENLSQKDPRWANTKIGNSAYFMWAKGSFITQIAQILGLTPDKVNEELMRVEGYKDDGTGNLSDINWEKIPEAFPGWVAIHTTPYDNSPVVQALSEGKKVLVEVAATPLGLEGTHCVQYIGNAQCLNSFPDPAEQVPTSTFPQVLGFTILTQLPEEANVPEEVKPSEKDAIIQELESLFSRIKELLN